MTWVLLIALGLGPRAASAGAAYAGMGDVGVGIADPSCELADNPAAAAATGVDRVAGVVHLAGGYTRLTFAGRVFNPAATTTASFPAFSGLGWTAVTPDLNEGRVGVGVWQVDRRVFRLDEELNLGLSWQPGGPALSQAYESGRTAVDQDDALYAAGGVWIQPLGDGDQQIAAGVLYLNQTGRGKLRVEAVDLLTGDDRPLRVMDGRRSMNGFGIIAGYFYRPMPESALGLSFTYLGPMAGHIWEQDEGAALFMDHVARPAQLRMALGGSFGIMKGLIAALDMRYSGEVSSGATLFAGTPRARFSDESTDATFSIHAGLEYRLPLFLGEMPLRIGYFSRPDPLPAATLGAGSGAVAGFLLPSVKQDVTGFTIGTGLTRNAVSADVAIQYLQVNTHTKLLLPGATAPVDSGDVRPTVAAIASFTIRFGPKAED